MNNNLDNFESSVHNAMTRHEVPYDKESWNDMSKRLDALTKPTSYKWVWYAAIGVVVLTSIVLYQTNIQKTSTENNTVKNEQPQNKNYQDNIIVVDSGTNVSPEKNTVVTPTKIVKTNIDSNKNNDNTPCVPPTITIPHDSTPVSSPNDQEDATPNTSVPVIPSAEFTMSAVEGCEGMTLVCFPNKTSVECDYTWDLGDGSTFNGANPMHTYNKAGKYIISLIASVENSGKHIEKRNEKELIVHSTPDSKFSWSFEQENINPNVIFESKSSNGEFQWTFGDGFSSNDITAMHKYSNTGIYQISLTRTGVNNCSNTTTKEIRIDKLYNLYAEAGFTPNGNGTNDYFLPQGLTILELPFTMTIYNSKGQLVFETSDKNDPWDGRCKDGALIEDTYVWIVVLKTSNTSEEIHKGTITLLK